ncbi:MAG TPA: methyltransferase [Planctomycetota bacterium]
MQNPSQSLPPQVQLFQMITGFAVSQAIFVAAKLNVAERVAAGAVGVEQLAREVGADPDALYRLLRALASVGVFTEAAPRRFGNTPLSECLRRGVPGSQHAGALMISDLCYPSFGELRKSVETGRPAFDTVFGAPIFDYLARHPEQGRGFDDAMASIHGPETAAMIAAYGFGRFKTIVDVGGGNGSTLIEILASAPQARGIVFDLPSVVERTTPAIRAAGLEGRCRAEAGSFFESVPKGADACILRHIIHDWDDEKSILILRRCREAMAPGGKVLVVEGVVPAGDEPHPSKWLDIIMLNVPGGRERTRTEYEALLAAAGLRLERIVATRSPVSVLEAVAR